MLHSAYCLEAARLQRFVNVVRKGLKMKRKIALAAASVVAAFVVGTAAPAAPAVHSSPLAAAKTCPSGYTRAIIGGAVKCLHAGEFCAIRDQRQYRRSGYYCVPASHRLRRR
jgi:hypothetical protein